MRIVQLKDLWPLNGDAMFNLQPASFLRNKNTNSLEIKVCAHDEKNCTGVMINTF